MRANPEFLRNFWLEITPQRLIIFPTILFAWFYLLTLFDGGRWVFFYTSIYFFFFITGVWGAQRAAGTITSEIQGKTWLLQRLTSMKPWSMVWGKLLGGLIITWYGGVLCLAAFIYSQQVLFDDVTWFLTSEGLLTANLYLIGSGVFCQIIGMISGMAHLKFNKFGDKLSSRNNGSLMGLIFGIALIVFVVGRVNSIPTSTWYGLNISSIHFATGSLYLAVAWGFTGLYMLMRREFQMRCHPMVWLGFLIFIIFYSMGFEYSNIKNVWGEYSTELNRLTVAFVILVFLVYGMMAWERTDGFGLRQFLLRLKFGRYQEAIYEFPRWIIAAVISFMMAGILMVSFPIYDDVFTSPPLSPNGFIVALICFMVRDLALILYFHISDKPKRAGLNSVVSLIFLYGLIPAIIFSADMEQFIFLFYPLYEPVSIWKSILPSFLQALILCIMVYIKWRGSKFHQSKLQPC